MQQDQSVQNVHTNRVEPLDQAPAGTTFDLGEARIVDAGGNRRLPIGDDGFESVMRRSLFVDKSMLVADVLDGFYKVTLFCRPRRFGKTLAMTMLKAFLELPPDGVNRAPLFEGLKIWEACDGRYRAHQGVYPVIYLSLNDVKKTTWPEAYAAIEGKMAAEYQRHAYLLDSDRLVDAEKAQFKRVADKVGSRDDVESSLRQLALYLAKHHRRGVVILIDEYDAPIMTARANGYYREAVNFTKGFLTGALKDGGAALEFACLTGVQRIAKESIFSDLNNITVDTPLDTESEERFGFTEEEVSALASYLGYPDRRDEVKDWYDGYRFGDTDIYNPWSVLNYFAKRCRPGVYWANTASNSVVGEAVRSTEYGVLDEVFGLLAPGGTVLRPLDMAVVFPEGGVRGDALWSMLYLAGYLTTEDIDDPGDHYRLRAMRLPNREIAQVFRGEIVERFRDVAGGTGRLHDLHAALVAGDGAALEAELARVLATSPSCRDLIVENSYHMLLTGLLFGVPGYGDPVCNREGGRGYYDLRLDPDPRQAGPATAQLPTITVEFKTLGKDAEKTARSQGDGALRKALAGLAGDALAQIAEKDYDAEVPAGRTRLRYGVAFAGKDVAVAATRA